MNNHVFIADDEDDGDGVGVGDDELFNSIQQEVSIERKSCNSDELAHSNQISQKIFLVTNNHLTKFHLFMQSCILWKKI